MSQVNNPLIPTINKKISEIIGEEKLNTITTINPKLALQNKRIDIEEPNKIELALKEKIKMSSGIDFDKVIKKFQKSKN